ncbi:MCE family protein [Streptomyces sp. WMMB 322]|uniref:MCE family protein n=1 Tax=Streptomyces sp. WMMB 322 TaxID=1286821 RepID=UPI0006E2EC39|nr:MCE family protein [Streptomyces sp. WMMB 322]SCK27835.1 virulence factor Mce family protein [Streptomyces sp. WMMB 322]
MPAAIRGQLPAATIRGPLSTAARLRLYGVVFLTVIALLLSLTVAVYQQVFTPVVRITLEADTLGNQLQRRADVKLRGLIVGEVRDVRADGKKATLDIALQPAQTRHIPSDVHARLLPKTLFGEKYVDLVTTAGSSQRHIEDGDVITQDRTRAGMELQKLMDDLLPLLRAVRPGDLNATLSAFATALEGRGEKLGSNFTRLEAYLRKLNPHMPALQRNISRLADTTEIYADAAPDLLRVLRNTITTSRTVVEKKQTLRAFLTGTTTASDTLEGFLGTNGDRLITLGRVSRPTLALLDEYSPEYPCLLNGLVDQSRRSDAAFRGGKMRITLEFVRPRPGYEPGEEPRNEANAGPFCAELPNPPVPAPDYPFADGTSGDRSSAASAGGPGPVSGTAAEQRVIGPLVAPVMGESADEVPPVATLLFGPMARGTKVNVA